MKSWLEPIKEMGACVDALEWADKYGSLEEAWVVCERGDWMLWLLGKLSGPPESESRKKLVLATCQCARLALPYVRKGDARPLKAIEAAEAWVRGEASLADVRKADAYAAAAADAYAADAAAAAAYA
ncbi:MAG: putative immunity protein, partial [Chloroflexota bacterium]